MITEPFRSASDRDLRNCPTACFSIHADADPGLMPRILEIFVKRGLVPTRWHSGVVDSGIGLAIDLEMNGLAPDAAARIAAEMRAVWGVGLVLLSDKQGA